MIVRAPRNPRIPRDCTIALFATSMLLVLGCAHSPSALDAEMRPTKEGRATPARMPPFIETDDANAIELERARAQGDAFGRELEWVRHEESAMSGDVAAGPYVVTYLITPVDDYYDLEAATASRPAHHDVVEPGAAHVGVVVRDAADGRLVQGLTVRAELVPNGEGRIRRAALPFGWHPILNRYGENVILPKDMFTLRVVISPPVYARHDSVNGNRFSDNVIAEFAGVVVSRDSLGSAVRRFAAGESRSAIELARGEGDMVARAIERLTARASGKGVQKRVGDFDVLVTTSRATPHWTMQGGALRYIATNDSASAHLDVVIREAATGRLLTGLDVRAVVLDARGRVVGVYAPQFMWHPWLNHYGVNVRVPADGRYTIKVHADAPTFRRYGSTAGKRFTRELDATFTGIRIATAPE